MKNKIAFLNNSAAGAEPSMGFDTGFLSVKNSKSKIDQVWKWGADNLFPLTLSGLSRNSTIHRRILNDKADYISGRGFSFDQNNTKVASLVSNANGEGQTLRAVMGCVAFDKALFGNAFLEVVTDKEHSFLSLYHQDATRCRISADYRHVVMHHDWSRFAVKESQSLPLFPVFESRPDGTLRTIIHYKDYEPGFRNYGVPKYIAAMGAASIAYKTDKWNVSRLDNAFQLSGVMVLDGQVDSPSEASDIARLAENKFAGKPGQVMFVIKNGVDGDTTKFVPIASQHDGDWRSLHQQASSDIIVAHSWYRTLSGMDYSTGFSPERIQYEYNIALTTVIAVEQHEMMEPIRILIREILEVESHSLDFINRPPFQIKQPYMKIWEARKEDGLPYDENDKQQQQFLSEI